MMPVAAGAENLIVSNPDLDVDIAGWTGAPQQASWWTSDDADGCPESGAFAGQTTGSGSVVHAAAAECHPVQPGETIHQAVAYRSPKPVSLRLILYAGAGCSGSLISEIPPPHPASLEWRRVVEVTTIPASGVAAVRFAATARDESGPSSFSASFDRAYVGRNPRVFADDFEGGGTCRWSATAPGAP